MDGDEEHGFYSSRERDYETYAYGSNGEESQHQGYNQYQSDDEQYYENNGGYDGEGYEYEDRFHAYSQQISYGGVYDQGERYHNPQWEEYDQSDDQEVPYDQYPPSPQGESFQYDILMAQMIEFLNLQKEANKRLEQIEAHQKMLENRLAQQATEISYMSEALENPSEEVLVSFEDQRIENSSEMLGQAFKEENDDEDLSAVDYILGFFSNDELVPCIGESLEVEQETARGLGIQEELFDDANDGLSREPPCTQEFISKEEDIEAWTPIHHNEDIESWLSIEPWSSVEDPYLFTLPPSKFWSFRPYLEASLERNSHDSSTLTEKYLLKGSKSVFDVQLKFGGRKYIWDIKIS